MKRNSWRWGCIVLLLGLGAVHADDAARLYGELYQRSGLEAQLAQTPALIIQNFRQETARGKGAVPRDVVDDVAREIRKAFSPSVLRAVITAYLRGHLAEADARSALQWLDTPLGVRITRLEEQAASPAGQVAIERFAETLDKSTMSREQVQLVKRLMDATQAVEMTLDLTLTIQKAVAAAALAASQQEGLETLPELFAQIDGRREEMRLYFDRTLLISALYTYQSLTPEELRSYLKFISTRVGKRYQQTMFEGLRQASAQAALRLGTALGKLGDTLRSRKSL